MLSPYSILSVIGLRSYLVINYSTYDDLLRPSFVPVLMKDILLRNAVRNCLLTMFQLKRISKIHRPSREQLPWFSVDGSEE